MHAALRRLRGSRVQASVRATRCLLTPTRSTHERAPVGEAWATVRELTRLSPTTTGLRLEVDADAEAFAFAPGQWVDFYIPGVDTLGGYSITSVPSDLPALDLAVKASSHPPAAWCTGSARVGDRVAVRVGGKFVLEDADAALLVAGGVGINPLYSMLKALCARDDGPRAALLYASRTCDELLFADELDALARSHPERLRVVLHATREAEPPAPMSAGPGVVGWASGRVDDDALVAALRWLGCEPNALLERRAVPWMEPKARAPGTGACAAAAAYVCGPPRMTEETVAALRRMGVSSVRSEQWW